MDAELNTLVTTIDHWLEDVGGSAGKDRKPLKSFEDAPHRDISAENLNLLQGYNLFVAKCAVCHTLGKEDLVGPDLKGVTTRRDPAWIAHYLMAPDQMRAEKDPIATELHAKYNRVPMPNLGLTGEEVGLLMDFLKAQTNAFEKERTRSLGGP